MLIRTNAPVFGASEQLAPVPGEWQFGFNYRGLESDDHYNGIQFQYQRESIGNYVVNTQQLYDLSLSYNFTERITLSGSIPIVNASWSLPQPTQPPLGPRREQNSSGLGDISALARFWMMTPSKHPNGNFSLGIGFKAPTGQYDVEDEYPDINGTTNDSYTEVDAFDAGYTTDPSGAVTYLDLVGTGPAFTDGIDAYLNVHVTDTGGASICTGNVGKNAP